MRKFNVTGLCIPGKHYMVDITNKLIQIKEMVDDGDYFTINQSRQFGKTTTLKMLQHFLESEYIVISISFEDWGDAVFATEGTFCQILLEQIKMALKVTETCAEYQKSWVDDSVTTFERLSAHIGKMCHCKNIVLMIDEVDKTSNNRVFLQFLGVLRAKFLKQQAGVEETFKSVILAGVYDVKNVKLKMISDGIYTPKVGENNLRNSPWNIATNFEVDLSFNPFEIETMLTEYEKDHQTGMDISTIAQEIYIYTFGYPFMVSRICQIIHRKLNKDWSSLGVGNGFALLLKDDNQLFNDLAKNLENDAGLYKLMHDVLMLGIRRSYVLMNPVIERAVRYGYIKERRGSAVVSNKVFETLIVNYFVSKNEEKIPFQRIGALDNEIIKDDSLDMALLLEKFAHFFNRELFPTKEKELLEVQYRLSFISYLKPFLNGIGHYHLESQLTDERRLDVVVNYLNNEYIIELKRIFTEKDRTDGIEQLLGYMSGRNAQTGYFLTFDFRKKSAPTVNWLEFGEKRILEINV